MDPTKAYPVFVPTGTGPAARAQIRGDGAHLALTGYVNFYPHKGGVLVVAELWGLPYEQGPCKSNVLGLHIHEKGRCTPVQNREQPAFSDAGEHYNPGNCPHPAHAGDLPPLFSIHGYAWQGFYTDRFTIRGVLGRAVVVHSQRDDFSSQPAGDAGMRIGCGVIEPLS